MYEYTDSDYNGGGGYLLYCYMVMGRNFIFILV